MLTLLPHPLLIIPLHPLCMIIMPQLRLLRKLFQLHQSLPMFQHHLRLHHRQQIPVAIVRALADSRVVHSVLIEEPP